MSEQPERARERWDREDETEAARSHELELARLRQSPWVTWAETFKISFFWLLVGAVICFLAYNHNA